MKQRARIESPSNPQEEVDRELALEDPALEIPVYWLGRRFAPPGLPVLALERAEYLRGGSRNEVEIVYAGDGGAVTLELWRADKWRRLKANRRAASLADVRFREVVVAVKPTGAYDSRRGMEAVVRGLRRR